MEKKNKKLGKKIGITILIVFFGLIACGMVWLLWTGSTKDIETTAGQLKARSDWKLTGNYVEPPRNVCIDVECPSVRKTWELPAPISKQEFENTIKESGWRLEFEDGCFESQDISRATCWARGSVNNYEIVLLISNSGVFSSKPTLQLTVSN